MEIISIGKDNLFFSLFQVFCKMADIYLSRSLTDHPLQITENKDKKGEGFRLILLTQHSSETINDMFWLAVTGNERMKKKKELSVLGREIELKIRFLVHKF